MQTAQAAVSISDISGHPAEKTMAAWIKTGWLKGDASGQVRPNDPISRIEWMTLANRVFGHAGAIPLQAKDLKAGSWKQEQAAIAVKAGMITYPQDGYIRPDAPVTRLEAAIMLSRLIDPDQLLPVGGQSFDAIPAYGQRAYASVYTLGLLDGLLDAAGSYKQPVTRAEAILMLDRALTAQSFDKVIDQPGTYGPIYGTKTLKGNLRLEAPGITLRNMTIEGNLTIGEGVGEKEAYLENVTVTGETQIEGGGENSIHFKDTVLFTIVVNKKTGEVRIVAEGKTTVNQVNVQSGTKIDNSNATTGGFSNVKLEDKLPAGSKVSLLGNFEKVEVDATSVNVDVPNGSIKNLNVSDRASGTQLTLGKDSKIAELTLKSMLKVTGEGKIEKATIEKGAEGSTFETKPSVASGAGAGSLLPQPSIPVAALQGVTATNGTITATMTLNPPAVLPASSFTITLSINGGAPATVVPTRVTVDPAQRTVTLTVPAVSQTVNEQSLVYNVTYRNVTKSAEPFLVEALPTAVLESVSAANSTVTGVMTLEPPAGLTAADFVVTLSINGGAAVTVEPTGLTIDAANRAVTLAVPAIAQAEIEQSLLYTVTYRGVTLSSTPLIIAALPHVPTVTSLVYGANVTVTGATYQLQLSAIIDSVETNVTSSISDWTSTNPSVITVDASGLVTAVGPGSATVTAHYAGFEAVYVVIVPSPSIISSVHTCTTSDALSCTQLPYASGTATMNAEDTKPYLFIGFNKALNAASGPGVAHVSGIPDSEVFGVYSTPNYLIIEIGALAAGTYTATIANVYFADSAGPQGPFVLTIVK
jgi:hypothetical protein